jgi:hypothetical protein
MMQKIACCGCLLIVIAWATCPAAQQPKPETTTESKSSYQKLTLTRRKDNGQYGTSAYSFRHESQDLGVHRNNVDIVYNGCGQIHINPHAGLQGRIADTGVGKLEDAKLAGVDKIPADSWRQLCLAPQVGHVYLHQGEFLNEKFVVVFKIIAIKADVLQIEWRFLGERKDQDDRYRYVSAGTMGQCGGGHRER